MLVKNVEDKIRANCEGFDPDRLREILRHLNRYYLLLCSPGEIANHLNLSQTLRPSHPVHILITKLDEKNYKIVVVAYDYFSAFSILCGLFASFGLNIEAGSVQTISEPQGRKKIIDLFQVKLTGSNVFDAPKQQQFETELFSLVILLEQGHFREARKRVNHRLIANIDKIETAETDKKGPFAGLLTPIKIRFDNHHSKQWTILSILGKDTPAFLYAFSNALAMRNIYIHKIRIDPHDGTIHNRFYISNRHGKKITGENEQKALKISAILIKQFIYFLSLAPDPMKAMTHFDQFMDKILVMGNSGSLIDFLKKKETMHLLARLFGTSDFLWEDFLRIRFDSFLPILEHLKKKPLQIGKKAMAQELQRRLRSITDHDSARQIVNHYKDEEMFRIDMRHMLEAKCTLEDFSRALSDLAEVIIQATLKICNRALQKIYGQAIQAGRTGKVVPFTICGFGKFGGRELGYASDIELLFIYESNGKTNGPKIIENKRYFELLAQGIIDFISARQEGIFSIDTRLRPYGNSGPPALSLAQFKKYYHPSGKAAAFERQALIKLRSIAGSRALGRKCETERDQFVYSGEVWDKKNALELRARQIDELVEKGRINVKYSAGGLIDIEYLTQYLQIIHGKDQEILQTTNTLEALTGLAKKGILQKETASDLGKTYVFIRKLIDALRMVRGNARDLLLPDKNSEEFVFLSRRMGFARKDWEEGSRLLSEKIQEHMERAHQHYHDFMNTT